MTLFWISLSWLTGILIGNLRLLTLWGWLTLATIICPLAVLVRRNRLALRAILAILTLLLAGARSQAASRELPPEHISRFNESPRPVTLAGWVDDFPEKGHDEVGLRIQVEDVKTHDSPSTPTTGRVLLRVAGDAEWRYGDRVQAAGLLRTPPEQGTFSYRAYLARQGILSILEADAIEPLPGRSGNPFLSWIYGFRAAALDRIQRSFPAPESELLAGVLLGIESGIPEQLLEAFNATGTRHVIAISGFNITILAAITTALFSRLLGARRGLWFTGIILGVYTLLVGADPSVIRAAVMGGLALLARMLGRESQALLSLAAAAMVMTLLDPAILWDIGFQLSFMAALGLVLYGEPMRKSLTLRLTRWVSEESAARITHLIAEFLLYSLAAQATSLPLSLVYFQRISLVSVIANAVVLPLQPPLMILGGVATLSGLVWSPIGDLLAYAAWPFPALTIKAVTLLAKGPFASLTIENIHPLWVALYYMILFGATVMLRSTAVRMQTVTAVLTSSLSLSSRLVLLASATGLVWRVWFDRPDGLTHITLLNTGGGESVLMETAKGRFLLLAGEGPPSAITDGLAPHMPLHHRMLDWIILPAGLHHPLQTLERVRHRFPCQKVLWLGRMEADVPITPPGSGGAEMYFAQEGSRLQLGPSASLEVVALGSQGALLEVRDGNSRMLFNVGAEPSLLAASPWEGWYPYDVLLLADGGFLGRNPIGLLERSSPWIVLASVAEQDSNQRPSRTLMAFLGNRSFLRSDFHGWIQVISDGASLGVFSQFPERTVSSP